MKIEDVRVGMMVTRKQPYFVAGGLIPGVVHQVVGEAIWVKLYDPVECFGIYPASYLEKVTE